jgi:outer membrane protein assembly factor BamB
MKTGLMTFCALATALFFSTPTQAAVTGWLNWRGPLQTSVSLEKGLPQKIDPKDALWTAEFPGQSTPTIADGRLYINGFQGEGQDLQEVVRCYDAETGKLIWEHSESDFLSDTIYLRYATSSPTIDPETGNVYVQGTQGLLSCFTRDGKLLWQHSLMEEFGRLTFPNSRTATPRVDNELVITRGITSAWGAHGAAGDRFYAYDKKTGELVWSSAPGERPQDNTFSNPYLDWWNGKRVLYSAGGDSSILAINARTGEPLWRFSFAKAGAKGGINAAVVKYGENLIALHESENIDSSEIGRMASFRIPQSVTPSNAFTPHVFKQSELENWRNAVGSLASSPILVGDIIYEVTGTGDLAAVDAKDGKVLWKKKLGIEQRQSTPFYADGLLYVAMYASAGDGVKTEGEAAKTCDLFVLKPSREGVEEISKATLIGWAYGSPLGYNGKIYLQTDKKLYCFGKAGNNPALAAAQAEYAKLEKPWPKPGPAKQLQAIPYEVLLKPGQSHAFRIRSLDEHGFTVDENINPKSVKWESFIPPTALVKVTMKGAFNADGVLVAENAQVPSAGQFKATLGEATGYIKGRVIPSLPLFQDFESFELSNTTTNVFEPPTPFAYPPLPWNSARFRFEVREKEVDGVKTKALTKTIDNKLFQRGQIFFGSPELKNYTIEADVLSEGNRRKMSEVGIINQRYAIILKGNSQEIEINSNQERIKTAVPFKWAPNVWYHLKARVDVAADGSGVVRGKAWKKGDPEPAAWTIEVPHKKAHAHGSPGLFGFAPQEQRVCIDNVKVTAN